MNLSSVPQPDGGGCVTGGGVVPVLFFPAEHLTELPPLPPVHVQLNGPEPVAVEAVPDEHRFVVGAELNEAQAETPQAPLTVAPPPLDPEELPLPFGTPPIPLLQLDWLE